MNMIDEEQQHICHECVGNGFLKKEIRTEGNLKRCLYCEKIRKSVKLSWFSDRIHSAIEEHFYLTSTGPSYYEQALLKDKELDYTWVRSGDPVNTLIQEIAGVDEAITTDVQEYLSESYGYPAVKDGEEDPYGDDAYYEECSPDVYNFQESWDFFCHEIKYRARYFGYAAEEILDGFFSDLDSLRTFDGRPVIRTAGPDREIHIIFRARVSQSQDTLDKILKNPVRELGTPLPKSAKNGRMNAAGISVFYGSTDVKTCIAEVRSPVGSHVVVGRFHIIREVHLLDFDALKSIYVKGSYFDPNYDNRRGHAAFLEHLVSELEKPVMPDDETFEYLPTQVVAEYLAEKAKPRLDGILFGSSQTEDGGQNVVLFNHSCRVEPYNGGSVISIDYGRGMDEDYDDSITILEQTPSTDQDHDDSEEETRTDHNDSEEEIGFEPIMRIEEETEFDAWPDNREFTLRLYVADIEVMVIEGVEYKTHERYTSRLRV